MDVGRRNPLTCIAHADKQSPCISRTAQFRHVDSDTPSFGSKLQCITDKIGQHLAHDIFGKHHIRIMQTYIKLQIDFPIQGIIGKRGHQFLQETVQIAVVYGYFHPSLLQFAEVHQLVYQRQKIFRVTFYQLQLLNNLRIITQLQRTLNRSHYQRKRSTKLMSDIRKKGQFVYRHRFQLTRHLQYFVFLSRYLCIRVAQQIVLPRQSQSLVGK